MVPKLAPLLARTHGDIGQDAIRAFAVPPTPDGLVGFGVQVLAIQPAGYLLTS